MEQGREVEAYHPREGEDGQGAGSRENEVIQARKRMVGISWKKNAEHTGREYSRFKDFSLLIFIFLHGEMFEQPR